MPETINLSDEIKKQLPAELVSLMQVAGEMIQSQEKKLYLVGGVVRDLLLGRANFDLDLVVAGDAISLAQQLADIKKGKIITHSRFGTAKLQWDSWNVDFTTARSETYPRPCVLPTVKPASIREDLFRRDFTINAMAVELNAGSYGKLLDLYGGREDLEGKLIRVLHEKSFIDDATRIWRGLRYEQRLNFKLEPFTLQLLRRDTGYLEALSGDRVRYELEMVLKEECPEKVLCRADELGVLAKLHPVLKGKGLLAE
ncbi:CCA tRNA nucleotidyltransferase, partial [Chloroflexota bacterium]